MEKVKAMSPRSIIYFVLAFLCALNAIFNMASCGDIWASWEYGDYAWHYGLWKIVASFDGKQTEYTFDEYCDNLGIEDCTVDQSISTARGATILGIMFFIPAACVYAYLAAKDKANFALEAFLVQSVGLLADLNSELNDARKVLRFLIEQVTQDDMT